jgi:hypothetical protein
MSSQRSNMPGVETIRSLIDHVLAGRMRVPAFQRGFVWDADRVGFFMDSVYKAYPFGSLLLWRAKETLKTERNLGPFQLPNVDPDYPIDYVLDGQQRLTSLFGVFQTTLTPEYEDDRFNVYFDRQADANVQATQFFAMPLDEDVDLDQYFPLRVLFDVVAYREATQDITDPDDLRLIDSLQTRFREVLVPIQTFETDERARVAIVFERVNRLGIELDTLQLLSAWTWSDDFYLLDEFDDLGAELEPFGFKLVGDDTNLLLRCCSAIIRGEAAPSALMQLNGAEVRDRFEEIENGIMGAIDFLRTNLHAGSLRNLPFGTLIVPLSVFFATRGTKAVAVTADQRRQLLRWFWRSCFGRRYSSDVIRKLEIDIREMMKLKRGEASALDEVEFEVSEKFFLDSTFNTYGVNTKSLILLLAQFRPKSFISGGPVGLQRVLKDYNRNEFHHLYPRAYLKDSGREARDINRLANFAFMSRADNQALGGVAPSDYRERMNEASTPSILGHSLVPESLFDDDFDKFIAHRAVALVSAGRELCENGEPVEIPENPVVVEIRDGAVTQQQRPLPDQDDTPLT